MVSRVVWLIIQASVMCFLRDSTNLGWGSCHVWKKDECVLGGASGMEYIPSGWY